MSKCHTPSCSSSLRSTPPKITLVLNDVLPPPGLGKCVASCSSECGLSKAWDNIDPLPPSVKHEVRSNVDSPGKQGDRKNRRFVCWEIFAGVGNLSKALKRAGCDLKIPIDFKYHSWMDLTHTGVQRIVIDILRSGHIHYIHFGTPCTVFSRARHNIRNIAKARRKETIGCELATFTAEACAVATSMGISWSIENPSSSRLWEYPDIRALTCLDGVRRFDFDMCRYGQPYKKPTSILSNVEDFTLLEKSCCHRKHDLVLKGKVFDDDRWKNRTELAGAYPASLCREWSSLVVAALKRKDVEKKPGPTNDQIKGRFQSTLTSSSPGEWRPNLSPAVIDWVSFGHHSKAEVGRRQQIHQAQRWKRQRQKAILEAAHQCAKDQGVAGVQN